jgi:hypothetical protein
MTLTGIAADVRAHNKATLTRRLLAVAAMIGGAVLGAVLVDRVRPSAALEVAAGLIAVVTLAAGRATRREGTWRSA